MTIPLVKTYSDCYQDVLLFELLQMSHPAILVCQERMCLKVAVAHINQACRMCCKMLKIDMRRVDIVLLHDFLK